MVAFLASVLVALLMTGVVLWVAKRRPVGAPLTWGEAAVAAVFVFALLFWVYGVVPHQWLTWADNELQWRADRIVLGPGGIVAKLPFTVTYRVVRDLIATGIYVVFLAGQVALWSVWQNRGKERPKEIPTSSYGRPLVRKA